MTRSKLTLSLAVAGLMAAGAASAQTYVVVPDGATPAVVLPRTTDSTMPSYSYTVPSTAVMGYGYVTPAYPVVGSNNRWDHRGSASNSSNVPDRAGEASTFTNGVPNLMTNNQTHLVLGASTPVIIYGN